MYMRTVYYLYICMLLGTLNSIAQVVAERGGSGLIDQRDEKEVFGVFGGGVQLPCR